MGLRIGVMEESFKVDGSLVNGLRPGERVKLSGHITYRQFGGSTSKSFNVDKVEKIGK